MKRWIAIAAMSRNRVIGKGNDIPWDVPADQAWFRRATRGHPCVMGRLTLESMGGKPLPKRQNIVVSRTLGSAPGVTVVRSLGEVDAVVEGEGPVFICGGENIYREAMPRCADVYLTIIDTTVEAGDAFFPEFEEGFELHRTVEAGPGYEVRHYVNREWRDRFAPHEAR